MRKVVMLVAFVCLTLSAYAEGMDYLTRGNFWKTVESKWQDKLPDYTENHVYSGYTFNANADFAVRRAIEVAANEYIVPVNITTEVNYKKNAGKSNEKKEYNDTLEMHVYHDIVNDDYWLIDHCFDGSLSKQYT